MTTTEVIDGLRAAFKAIYSNTNRAQIVAGIAEIERLQAAVVAREEDAAKHVATIDDLREAMHAINSQRAALLAAMQEARQDVVRVLLGRFCNLGETMREIDAAIEAANLPAKPGSAPMFLSDQAG